jgi:hypothetical protein
MEGPDVEEWKRDVGKWFDRLNPDIDDRPGVWLTFEEEFKKQFEDSQREPRARMELQELRDEMAPHRQIHIRFRETCTNVGIQPHESRDHALLHGRTTKVNPYRRPSPPSPTHVPQNEKQSG